MRVACNLICEVIGEQPRDGFNGRAHWGKTMKIQQLASIIALATIAIGGTILGCGGQDEVANQNDDVSERSGYEMHITKVNENYPSTWPITNPEDTWTAQVFIGDQTLLAPTHLFGPIVNVIPYSNQDEVEMADGSIFARGDQVIEYSTVLGILKNLLALARS